MSIMSILGQIEEIDLSKGYESGGNKLPDGTYDGYCEEIIYKDKEDSRLYVLKLKTTMDESYANFYSISAKTYFNLKNLVTSICRISGQKLNTVEVQSLAVTNPDAFVEMASNLIIGKPTTFTLKSNNKGFQSCEYEDSTMPF